MILTQLCGCAIAGRRNTNRGGKRFGIARLPAILNSYEGDICGGRSCSL
jgi:hypothetical protein